MLTEATIQNEFYVLAQFQTDIIGACWADSTKSIGTGSSQW